MLSHRFTPSALCIDGIREPFGWLQNVSEKFKDTVNLDATGREQPPFHKLPVTTSM